MPRLHDVKTTLLRLLEQMGLKVRRDGDAVTLNASAINKPGSAYLSW